MSFNMFKRLFPNTTIADLNKCIDKKVVLYAYNHSYILQIGICLVTIIHRH